VIALAEVIQELGRLAEAEHLYRRALAGREEQSSASDAATLIYREQTLLDVLCLAGLLEAQGGQGRLVEAETLYRHVLGERETLLGASHPDTLDAAHYLPKMLNKLDKRDEAEPLYRRAIPWLETELGENHASTFKSVRILAELLGKQGMEAGDEALSLSRRALAGHASSLGDTAEQTKDAAESLAVMLHETNGLTDRLEVSQLKETYVLTHIPSQRGANLFPYSGQYSKETRAHLRSKWKGFGSLLPEWRPAACWRGSEAGPYKNS